MPQSQDPRLEARKLTITRMLERLSAGDVSGFVEQLTPDYVRHCQAMPPELQELRGRDAMQAWLAANMVTFPDWDEQIEWLVAEGDHVCWRSRGRATMKGPIGPFPATGRKLDLTIIGMHRFEGDLIAETWTAWDNLSAFTQLGLMPMAEPA